MITIRHALPSPLHVPTRLRVFEKRYHINYIAATMCSCTKIPLDARLLLPIPVPK
jgi:hypothetical protein